MITDWTFNSSSMFSYHHRVDPSVHRLYDEIGAYSNSFASKVRAVELEEIALRNEEENLGALSAVMSMVHTYLSLHIQLSISIYNYPSIYLSIFSHSICMYI